MIAAARFVVFGVVLNMTVFGETVLAIGGAGEAARLAWAPVDRVKILVFALQGLVPGPAASSSPPSFWTACTGKRAAGRGPHPFEKQREESPSHEDRSH